MITAADYRRLPEQEARNWTCAECGKPSVYGTSETLGGVTLGVEQLRCTNCTARWASAHGLPFPRLCTVEVR